MRAAFAILNIDGLSASGGSGPQRAGAYPPSAEAALNTQGRIRRRRKRPSTRRGVSAVGGSGPQHAGAYPPSAEAALNTQGRIRRRRKRPSTRRGVSAVGGSGPSIRRGG